MIKKIKIFFAGIVSGALLCGLLFAVVMINKAIDEKINQERERQISIKQIDGEPAKITGIEKTKSAVTVHESYNGAGKSDLVIPFQQIPPAAAWINKRWGVSALGSPRGCLYTLGSYRLDVLTFTGGVRVPVKHPMSWRDYDVLAGVGFWFE
jgi:hypothetical protein